MIIINSLYMFTFLVKLGIIITINEPMIQLMNVLLLLIEFIIYLRTNNYGNTIILSNVIPL